MNECVTLVGLWTTNINFDCRSALKYSLWLCSCTICLFLVSSNHSLFRFFYLEVLAKSHSGQHCFACMNPEETDLWCLHSFLEKKYKAYAFSSGWADTWLDGVLLRCRVLRGCTSGVLLVLLAEEPETEAWTEAITLACSGGTYLQSKKRKTAKKGLSKPSWC